MIRLPHLPALPLAAALLCALLGAGCRSSRVIENTRVPELTVDDAGRVLFEGETLQLGEIGAAVRRAGFNRTQEVNILVPDNPDRKLMGAITGDLRKSGYSRTVFVKARKATATLGKPQR